MTLTTLVILLLLAGIVLMVAEALLPTQGLLGVVGAVAMLAAVVACFRLDSRVGFALLAGLVLAAPFAGMLWVRLYPKTPVGRRMILGPVASEAPAAPAVSVGQTGTTVSELRPMGTCEFGADRVEARAERGTIPAGARVRVVDVVDRRPTVRAV
jgi:membrane-bound serine protease (ClpP class)